MSNEQSVWPDGAREAVDAAHATWIGLHAWDDRTIDDLVLTALEPFVQQRIEAARHEEIAGYDQGYQDGESNAAADWYFALNEIGGFPDDFDYSPTTVAAEVARLREDGERLMAVLRLCAGDVVTCYPSDDGAVKVAINLNDYFVPASDGEEIEMADAPTLVALLDQGGWPAIYQWVADRRGIPNQHWRKRQIDAARSARGGEG